MLEFLLLKTEIYSVSDETMLAEEVIDLMANELEGDRLLLLPLLKVSFKLVSKFNFEPTSFKCLNEEKMVNFILKVSNQYE